MPKNRKRAAQKGAKSIAVSTKHKVGGRKSGQGVKHMTAAQLFDAIIKRPRDINKINRELDSRLPS